MTQINESEHPPKRKSAHAIFQSEYITSVRALPDIFLLLFFVDNRATVLSLIEWHSLTHE